ncbi:MAG: aromatic ring-hydroxylating dioxygenase subunit alpha [Gammaproteobacteria bacterium]|nr:aromatic ring-hydroxylating dioxygenase subunit alpha [Gammaproteobacteria bacterium]
MQREEQVRVIDGLLRHLDHGTNVDAGGQVRNPVSSYTCPDIAAQEWQEFFQNYPQLLGLSADLPTPGSFFTSTDLGRPILCTRDKSGVFHAFLNVCRHRGTIVETEARGEKRQFSCPFHAWSYDHGGELVAVPKEDHFGPVDKSNHGLVALPAEERYGLLWVNANPDGAMNVDDLLGDLAAELEAWQLDSYVRQGSESYDHAMNWKLAIDTFGETYHFNTLHKDTLANDFYGNVQLYDRYQRNHRMALCLKSIEELRETPRESWDVRRGALPVYYLFPNVQLITGMGGPTLVRVYPDGANPNQSHSQIDFYLDPMIEQALRDPEMAERYAEVGQRMQGFAEVIRDEDYVAAASAHQGAVSGAQQYVTFGRNEPALHHYHNTYREALGMPPLEVISN